MCVVFFKQKTAYELRISDWSSDVFSSDLAFLAFTTRFAAFLELYRLVQWNLALERVSGLHSFTGILPVVGLVEAFERRLQELQVAPPTPDWDGVYVAG